MAQNDLANARSTMLVTFDCATVQTTEDAILFPIFGVCDSFLKQRTVEILFSTSYRFVMCQAYK